MSFMPKDDLLGRVIDCSLAGFLTAMDISCHSFLRLAKLAEPLMSKGGCLLAMSYYGADHVVEYHNAMGPVKAALESCVPYLSSELGTEKESESMPRLQDPSEQEPPLELRIFIC
jgi:enoyl-[acyl-carrier protein] reductase I